MKYLLFPILIAVIGCSTSREPEADRKPQSQPADVVENKTPPQNNSTNNTPLGTSAQETDNNSSDGKSQSVSLPETLETTFHITLTGSLENIAAEDLNLYFCSIFDLQKYTPTSNNNGCEKWLVSDFMDVPKKKIINLTKNKGMKVSLVTSSYNEDQGKEEISYLSNVLEINWEDHLENTDIRIQGEVKAGASEYTLSGL